MLDDKKNSHQQLDYKRSCKNFQQNKRETLDRLISLCFKIF